MKHRCNLKTRIWFIFSIGLIYATSLAGASQRENDKLEFSLPDIFGREVHSQDYKGVPVFLEFGACW
jgi:hypothetical protein